jgi:colanic acid biosynthesis glycosyl transferase WcaI
MRILIITPYYEPDLGPSAPMFTLLSKGLLLRGHQVTVIAMVPNYPSGRVMTGYRGKWIQRSMEDGVEIVRIAIPSGDRSKLTYRLLQFISYQIGAAWASLNKTYDVSIISNPFLCSWLPLTLQTVFRGMPNVYSIYDVYPDVGIKLGIFRNKLVVSMVTRLERFCIDHSAIVQILSDSFRPGLKALGVPDSKMVSVALWVDTDLIKPLAQDNSFSQEYGLTNRFVVLYAGNIGLSQGLEHVLTTAELLVDQKDVCFVFVGDGAGYELLQSQTKQRNLSNVQFIPFQPRQRLPEVLACASVSLVVLRRGFCSDSIPSKTFSILASGRPLIACVDDTSEIWKLVKQAEAGMCVQPEDPAQLAAAILSLRQDQSLCERLGRNGRIWVEQYHSPKNAVEQFEQLLLSAASSKSLN